MNIKFKRGDYIVILRPSRLDSRFIKYGYCYKQRSDYERFDTDKDLTGYGCSTNIPYKEKEWWRYATEAEILEYKREDKPFDTISFTPVIADNYQIY